MERDTLSDERAGEDSSEEAVLLPPDLPQWDRCISFEGLGRDVVGLIAKRLNANDCFHLALTSRVTYGRIKALRLLKSAQTRFQSRYPKANLKSLQVRPLVVEMLSCPIPCLAEMLPPPQPEGAKKSCCVCYIDISPSVDFVVRLFKLRGYDVLVVPFETRMSNWPACKGKLNAEVPDTGSQLMERLRQSGMLTQRHTQGVPMKHIQVGGVTLLSNGVITPEAEHFEFVQQLCSARFDLVVDMCLPTGHVVVLQRWLGEKSESYMHVNLASSHDTIVFVPPKLLRTKPQVLGPGPPCPTRQEVEQALKQVPDYKLVPLLRFAQRRRELVLAVKGVLTKRGSRLARACKRLVQLVKEMDLAANAMPEVPALSGEYHTILYWLALLLQPPPEQPAAAVRREH